MLESLLEGYAEFYSVELAEKVKRGQDENALKCKNNGGSVPYGYFINSEHKFEINPEEAVIVKEIFKRYAERERIIDIANSLNERGLKTNRNKPFIKSFFTRLLKNRRYIGEYRYREVLVENGIPAIIDKDLFERVQVRLTKNKHAPALAKASNEEPYLLTTKLFCGDCGQAMTGESGKSHNGNIYYYYKCRSSKHKTGCKKKAIKKHLIENIVIERTIKLLFDETMLENLSQQAISLLKQESSLLPQLKKQLAETEKGIENILNAIQQGVFTKSTKQRLDELEETKERLEISIMQEEIENLTLTKEQILCWLHRFRTMDISKPEYRQQIIDYFVNSVYVFVNLQNE